MKHIILSVLFPLFFIQICFAQKTAYIPAYLLDITTPDGSQFSWDKTYEDSNFIIIWGNTVGTDPSSYPDPDLAFDPAMILDTMEFIYRAYKNFGFLDDATGTNLHQYKIPIIMYNTWGDMGAQGYANGGDADGIIGAFWVNPLAIHTGQVAAHELTHSLQAQAVIDYRTTHGLGAVWDHAGIFWETHANFMRNLLYPQDVTAWGMDCYHLETWGDWKNTYENYEWLMAVMETDGIGMVNRLWRESLGNEYPLQAYKRLAGYDQSAFNDKMFQYVRRMPAFDFNYNNLGSYFRQYRAEDLNNYLLSIQSVHNIMKKVPGAANRYEMPVEQSPEEYAYNIIPLYKHPDSCAVIIKFKGHTEANAHTGWRYGFVTTHADGTVSRYSDIYKDNTGKVSFNPEGDESKIYFVVMGAPVDRITTDTSNDTWHGYPKHFRFPYELTISGAAPEGFQNAADFRQQLKIDGHIHANGGGWVQNSASVAASVYIASAAMVLGSAVISGNVRIDNTALVKDAAISGNVQVTDNAFVNGGTYTGDVLIKGKAYSENNVMSGTAQINMRANVSNYHLSGNIEVGGDVVVYNTAGDCDNGVYYRLTNYYDDKLLECDGRTAAFFTNADVNNGYSLFSAAEMNLDCTCSTLPTCINNVVDTTALTPYPNGITLFPNPATNSATFHIESDEDIKNIRLQLYNATGALIHNFFYTGVKEFSLNVSNLPDGVYFARIRLNNDTVLKTVKLNVVR